MEFLSTVAAIGTVPLLILLVVIFILILKNQKTENENIKKTLEEYRKGYSDGLNQIKTDMDNFRNDFNKSLESVDSKICQIMKDYAEKTYVQEAVGGWRSEIRDVRQDIARYNERVDKVLLEAGRQK